MSEQPWPDWKLVLTTGVLVFIGYGVVNIQELILVAGAIAEIFKDMCK